MSDVSNGAICDICRDQWKDDVGCKCTQDRLKELQYSTPHALTREQVETICLDFVGDVLNAEQRAAIVKLSGSDAALRLSLAQLTNEMTALLEGKPLPSGLYVHHPFCNGDRRKPAGTPGVTCSCKVVSREALTQQAQELAYWKQQAAHFTKRCAEQGDSIAEDRRLLEQQTQEVERLKAEKDNTVGANLVLIERLAAMTTERDNYLSKWRASADLNKGLLRDYDASQARVRELETQRDELHKVCNYHEKLEEEMIAKCATLQATLAAREEAIKELEHEAMQEGEQFRRFAQEIITPTMRVADTGPISFGKLKEVVEAAIHTARQDAARLREALEKAAGMIESEFCSHCQEPHDEANEHCYSQFIYRALKGA